MKATKFEIISGTFFGILVCSIKLSICEATIHAPAINLTAKFLETAFEGLSTSDKWCNIPDLFPATNLHHGIFGHEAKEHSWPWMVSVQKLEGDDYVHYCRGSLVARNKVLTAAHCFNTTAEGEQLIIKLGLHFTYDKKDDDDDGRIEVDVKHVEIHEEFNKNVSSSQNDIALITLQQKVNYTDWIFPICIGKKSQLTENSTCYVTGWDKRVSTGENSADLQQLSLPITDDETCVKVNPKVNTTTQFCGGYLEGGKDSCQGDSGGPVVCQNTDNEWRIYGIVSYGTGCAQKGKLGVYTRVSFFRRWLADHINT